MFSFLLNIDLNPKGQECKIKYFLLLISVVLIEPLQAQITSFGFRTGVNTFRQNNRFRQYEIFVDTDLPYQKLLTQGISIQSKLELTGGVLQDFSENSMVFSAGPGLELDFIREYSFIEAGISPTFITKHSFRTNELGGLFNFTSYAGIYFSPLKFLIAGYRFQHMSNAGIYQPNPGVNLHIIEIRVRN